MHAYYTLSYEADGWQAIVISSAGELLHKTDAIPIEHPTPVTAAIRQAERWCDDHGYSLVGQDYILDRVDDYAGS